MKTIGFCLSVCRSLVKSVGLFGLAILIAHEWEAREMEAVANTAAQLSMPSWSPLAVSELKVQAIYCIKYYKSKYWTNV